MKSENKPCILTANHVSIKAGLTFRGKSASTRQRPTQMPTDHCWGLLLSLGWRLRKCNITDSHKEPTLWSCAALFYWGKLLIHPCYRLIQMWAQNYNKDLQLQMNSQYSANIKVLKCVEEWDTQKIPRDKMRGDHFRLEPFWICH